MKIAIDVDGVLLNMTTIFKYAFTYYNEEYYPATDWDMHNYPEHIREHILFTLFGDENMMTLHMPFKDNYVALIKKLYEWKEQGHELYILSSRCKAILEKTRFHLLLHFQNIFKDILIIQGSKIPYLKEYEIDLLIDDGNKNIEACLENNINVIMISDDDQVYNHYLRNKVKWCKSILEVKL